MPSPAIAEPPEAPGLSSEAPLAWLRWPAGLALALVFAVPFLFTAIPPIVDVPGHIGRMAVASAPEGSMLREYFSFQWAPVLNLGSDLLVELLRPAIGLFAATWLICAIVPVITALGVISVARALNPRGAHALPWSLIFVFNWPFLYGFLNYSLGAGLSLLAFALWIRLERRRGLRAGIFVPLLPLLMLCHAIGGGLSAIMIGSYEVWRRKAWLPGNWRPAVVADLARILWPTAGVLLALGVWKALAPASTGRTAWLMERKPEAMLMALRDQNIFLDVGSVAAAFAVLALGWLWGARFRRGAAGPAAAVTLLLLCMPAVLTTADRIDTRLAPMVPMLALALQDWSGVRAGRRRAIALAGAALLAVRLTVTTIGFIGYDRSYTSEIAALDHVRQGSRVLAFTTVGCKLTDWRVHRLEHISNLATASRNAWVNSHWEIDGVNLIQVRYRPSHAYYRDPSEVVHPERCIDMAVPPDERGRKTIAETLERAPVDRADYLWLINERLPADYSGPALDRLWSNGTSELYAVRNPVPMRVPAP